MSTNQGIFQQINVHFSTFCRKFQYFDIIYSQNNGTSQQVEVQKRFRSYRVVALSTCVLSRCRVIDLCFVALSRCRVIALSRYRVVALSTCERK